jgi:hypothetical protein
MVIEPKKQEQEEKQEYEAPRIIYEGEITTRAGSPGPDGLGFGKLDPEDLYD